MRERFINIRFILFVMGTYYGVRKVVEIGQRIDFPLEGDPLGIGDDVLVGL